MQSPTYFLNNQAQTLKHALLGRQQYKENREVRKNKT